MDPYKSYDYAELQSEVMRLEELVQAKDAEIASLTADLERVEGAAFAGGRAGHLELLRRAEAAEGLYRLEKESRENYERSIAHVVRQLEAADAARLQAEQHLEGLKANLRGLAEEWLAIVCQGVGPTDRMIGYESCANELLARLDAKE